MTHQPESNVVDTVVQLLCESGMSQMALEKAPSEYSCLFTCIALTGLRLAELLALKWKHLDFNAGVIKVEQSLWRGQIVAPKTIGSARIVPYGAVLGEILSTGPYTPIRMISFSANRMGIVSIRTFFERTCSTRFSTG